LSGASVYYEPILRARRGSSSETALFRWLSSQLTSSKQRLASFASLAQKDDLESIYWGGAAFCLAADVTIRAQTHGLRSLDDALRAILARGGDATRVWTVDDVLRTADMATETTVLRDLYSRHVIGKDPIDVQVLFAALGVGMRGATPAARTSASRSSLSVFDDTRPLAWIRRDIATGSKTFHRM